METRMASQQGHVPEAPAAPVLPAGAAAPAGETSDPGALAELRRFHLGDPGPGAPDLVAERELLPALLHPFRDPQKVRSDYPLFLPPLGEDVFEGEDTPFCLSLTDLLSRLAPEGEGARILRDNLLRLERRVRAQTAGAEEPLDAREVLEQAAQDMIGELKLGAGDREALQGSLDALLDRIQDGSRFLPLGERTPLHLLEQAGLRRLLPRREGFLAEVRRLAGELDTLLEVDRRKRPDSRGAESIDASMGAVGSQFLDSSALSEKLGAPRGSLTMSAHRRERVERAAAVLREFLASGDRPVFHLLHDGSVPGVPEAPVPAGGASGPGPFARWRAARAEDPCAAAAARFDEEAAALAEVLKAVRTARLETADAYDPSRHDPWLARFDWQAMTRDELLLLPPVAALVAARTAAREGMLSLSRLLLSGRPVQVVTVVRPAENPGSDEPGDPLSGFRFEPGYLGMSHREALVSETSVARPFHMVRGFTAGAAAACAALHVVAGGRTLDSGRSRLGDWLHAGAALEGRAHPLFRYDPAAGATWARRLDFADNPVPEKDWPTHDLAVVDDAGVAQTLSPAFTFADFALLEPALAGHFRPVADDLASPELVTVDAWLDLPVEEAAAKVPFVWAVDGRGRLVRTAVTRALALGVRDRLDYWRTLQELAGIRSEYVDTAVQRAREEAEAAAREELGRLRAEHEVELEEVRRAAAEEVADRLTAALLSVDVGSLTAPAAGGRPSAAPAPGPASAPAAEAPAPAETPAEPAPAPAEEEAGFEPYIDTDLCTTCNECTNLNPQMFAYNADKKAFIKDPRAGTFADLVKAAEKCPARIIHPGTPLDPDEPGLADLVERAKKFN